MAQLGNLLVTGSSRLLGKLFCNDISVGNSLSVKTLSATNFTATSITTSGLTVNGNATTTGTLNVGNSATNGKVSLNNRVVIRDNGHNWLGINDQLTFAEGVYFGTSRIRADGIFQLGENGNKILFNTTSAKFSIPVTINNALAANNITATNVTVNDTLKAFKYDLNTIQDLGGEFCVAPTIYIQSGATVNVSKASSTTITVSILDKTAITSDSIQGVRWAQNSKIKFQGKIDGLNIRCSGIMAAKLNTTANTMSLTLTVESSIANHFATAKNGASYSDISVMLYQRYGKKIGSTTENIYSPVGIRMSATGSTNAAPYVDIWGNKSNSDPDTVYTIPSVRLGYLDGLKCGNYDCVGYGLYADNVYLNGIIISNSGQLGGFKIGTNDLSNGTWGTDKSVLMSTGTTENKAVGGSSAISGWCFTAGSKFGVTTSGDLYASNAKISGTVTSENGKIGGFTISQYNIKGTNVGLGCASGHDHAFWAGASTGSSAPFRVGHDGALTATNATITGTITSDNITATSGSIGSFKLDSTYLQSSDKTVGLSASSADWAFWAGGSSATTAKFRVTRAGQLYASNITAYGGTIGGWTIEKDKLYAGDANSKFTILKEPIVDGSGFDIDGNMYRVPVFITGADKYTDVTAPFVLYLDGFCHMENIEATGGKIGGWVITSDDIRGSNIYDGTLYTIGLKNITTEGSSSFSISDQDFIYSDLTSNNETVRTIAIKPVGQIHLQGISTSGMPGYTILDNNGIQISSLDQKLTLFKSHLISNNSTNSTNSFYIYSQNILSHHIQLADEEYTNLTNTSYGIYCSKDAFFGGSTKFGNWKISNTRIASSNTISMGAKEAGIMIVNEKDKPYVLVQNSSGDSLFSIEKNGSITHNGNRIGQTYVDSFTNNKAISNAAWANTGVNITLPAGTYVIMGSVHFANAKGGRRAIRFASGSTGLAYTEQIVPVDSNATINSALQCQWIVSPTSQTTYNLQAFQASGGSINMTSSYIKAVRIS